MVFANSVAAMAIGSDRNIEIIFLRLTSAKQIRLDMPLRQQDKEPVANRQSGEPELK